MNQLIYRWLDLL